MSTFAKTPRFRTEPRPISKTPRWQIGQKPAGNRQWPDVDKGNLEIFNSPLISAVKGDQVDGGGIVQSETYDLRANKDYSAWIKKCGENKENSLFAAKDIVNGPGGKGEEYINEILRERLSLLKELLENVQKEIDFIRA
jgi:hypothetical protein